MEDTQELGKIIPIRRKSTPPPTFVVSDDWEPAVKSPKVTPNAVEVQPKPHGPKSAAEEILGMLSTMTSPISREGLRISKEVVSDYTREQVETMLRNSTELDWKRKPAFYKALAERYSSFGGTRRRTRAMTTREYLKSQGAIVDDSTKFDDD